MPVGYEVLFSTVQSDLRTGDDAFVVVVHWTLINNGFKCIGKGENVPNDIQALKGSELLPKDWNSDKGVYCMLYTDAQHLTTYLLKLVSFDGEILVHFMRIKDSLVGDAAFKSGDYCTGDLSSYDSALKNVKELQSRLESEILAVFKESKPMASDRSTHANQGKSKQSDRADPLRAGPSRHPDPTSGWGGSNNPFTIGRGDVDPLAGPLGGGMLMDPMRGSRFPGGLDPSAGGLGLPNRLPRGSVPPGARFDPIGPPDMDRRGHRAGPDPDHMRPPGFEDDMFM